MTPEEEILAANAQYVPNRVTPFTITPEGQKYGVIDINGTVGHIQQDKRTPEQQNALFDLYQGIAPMQVDRNNPTAVRNYNTQVYNQLHKEGKVDDFYRSKGLIAPIAAAPATPAPKTPTDIAAEAASTGKSFLQLYQESMPKPEYEQERADRIQTNSKASIIADILKLVGEGVTTKKGGTPIVRQSAVPMLNAELQKLNDLYKQEAKAYKQGGFNALLMDEQEKKRALIQKAKDEAAKAVKQMEIDAAAKKDQADKKFDIDKLDKQQKFTATENAKNRSTTLTAAKMRAENSENSDKNTVSFIDKDNQIKYIPKSEQKAWSAKLAKMVIDDPTIEFDDKAPIRSYPENAWTYWEKYLEYDGKKLRLKGSGTASTNTTGSRASRATQSSAPRSRASN